MSDVEISVVSPVYCCADCLRALVPAPRGNTFRVSARSYEIILVDDASPDDAWPVLREFCAADPRIKAIALSRNFGQHYAIAAGIEHAVGRWVVVIDCDLQDRPEEIASALRQSAGRLRHRLRRTRNAAGRLVQTQLVSRLFIALLNYLSGADYDYRTANFGIYSRAVIDAVRSMGDRSRFFPVMVRWTGFRKTSIPVQHDARNDGSSSYTLRKLMRLALDIMLSYSDKPLRLVATLGIIVSMIALAMTGFSLYRYLHGDVTVAGYTSLIASMWLLAGVILFCMGIIGLYVGRVFENVKSRPIFIVRDQLNL